MTKRIKGMTTKAKKTLYFSWTLGKMLDENTGEERKMFKNMPPMDVDHWNSLIVSVFLSKKSEENTIFIVSPESFSMIELTPQFKPNTTSVTDNNFTKHRFMGTLSPSNKEIWVNAFWPTNIISSFDNMDNMGNKIDFISR